MARSSNAPAPKFPGAVLFHDMPWTDWLDSGETIASYSVASSDPALVIDQVTEQDGVIYWRVSGGVSKQNYTVTVSITTSRPRTDKCALTYRIR